MPRDERSPRASCLTAGHLLLEDGRDERLQDGAAPGQADAGEPTREVTNEAMVVGDGTPRPIEPEQGRDGGERALRTWAPGLRPHVIPRLDERDGGRAIRRPGRAPGSAARDPERRIAGASAERREGQGEVEVPVVGEGPAGHTGSLSRFRKASTHHPNGPDGGTMVRLSRRATPQGRRERGAHRRACHRRRPRSGRVTGPQPIRPAGRRSLPASWRWRLLSAGRR